MDPITTITSNTVSLKSGNKVTKRKTPAATMVAAWIKEDTDVGPSMASGSHTCNGYCADLAMAPIKKAMPATVSQVASLSTAKPPGIPA